MKTTLLLLVAAMAGAFSAHSQGTFENLDFEQAVIVSRNPTFGFLDWSLAAPGWSHSDGSDTAVIYYGGSHIGGSQYYLLMSSNSPVVSPGTQLAGKYSMSFVSGTASSIDSGSPWVQAYLSQTGIIPMESRSIRLLAKGPFQLFVSDNPVVMQSLGGNAYAGDVSAFAGLSTELKIINTSVGSRDPVVLDNILFSALPVPEPSSVALLGLGILLLMCFRCRMRPTRSLETNRR